MFRKTIKKSSNDFLFFFLFFVYTNKENIREGKYLYTVYFICNIHIKYVYNTCNTDVKVSSGLPVRSIN